jgi:hypothetical protein
MRFGIRAALVLAAFMYCSDAAACSCVGSGPPCQAFFQTDAVVFLGTVRGITDPGRTAANILDRRVVSFSIESALRNIQGSSVNVRTGLGGGDCGFDFKPGLQYLVYAYRHTDGHLSAGICSRTRLASEAAEDLAYLGTLPSTGAGGRMFGTINHWEHDPATRETVQYGPVADVQILLRGTRGTFSGTTDTAGKYSVSGIPAGSYDMEVLPPPAFSTRYQQRKIEFTDPRACRAEDFSLHYDGRISGTILDASGRPVPNVPLDLVAAAHPDLPLSIHVPNAISDGSGRLELIDVPPGSYLVAVGLKLPMDAETTYPVTYYPGTSARERARAIEIGAGSHVQLDPLRVAEPLPRQTLSGTVVLPDGTPVSGANVSLQGAHGAQAASGIRTDAQGRFTFRVFAGLTYTAHAWYNVPDDPGHRQVQATQVVRIAGAPASLRLVLSPR